MLVSRLVFGADPLWLQRTWQRCDGQLWLVMPDEEHREAVMAPLLPFQRQMVSELLDEDGLCIMSAGLGWQKVPDLHVGSRLTA